MSEEDTPSESKWAPLQDALQTMQAKLLYLGYGSIEPRHYARPRK